MNDMVDESTPAEIRYNETIRLGGQLPRGYRLCQPIDVRVWIENDEFVADSEDLRVRGFGDDPDEAVAYLKDQIVDQFLRLREHQGQLAEPMRRTLARFEALVQSSHAQL